ncbi:arginase family protein [Peribacillus alkalitolerans]|uniref:arginase family protein n=1 Tax=Peribacillus alkalitolerans TaxID=1550385 RepID=UPI0013CFB3FF|nr:arginase family protein [Peribacillus alkalitolerans]
MRKIYIVGLPSYAGALYAGTESAPASLREAGIVERFEELGFQVVDKEDLLEGKDLIRHNISPIRNWPSPRNVWETIVDNANEIFQKDSFTILLGGDCSIVVGSYTAFQEIYGDNTHLLVIDGHVDTVEPVSDNCIGAAAMGLWFFLKEQPFWSNKRRIDPSSISVIGPQSVPEDSLGMTIIPLAVLEKEERLISVQNHLASLPEDVSILVHFDVDVLIDTIMPAAYSPSEKGLDLEKAWRLFQIILSDKRVKGIEITEFSGTKDEDGKAARVIIDLLAQLKG